jgi:general secretion pathway protein G
MSKKIVIAVAALIVLVGAGGGAQYYFSKRVKKVAPKTYKQQVAETTGKIEVIGDDLTIIRQECKKYPESLDELVGDGFCSKSCPQVDCLKSDDLVDAWGHRFDYFHDSERLTIRSRGKDAREGGTGENEDFTLMLPMNPE